MAELPPDCEAVFRSQQRGECMELRLVLSAAGISAETGFLDGWWLLVVNRDDLAIAAAELDAYQQENRVPSSRPRGAGPVYGGAGAAVVAYAGVVVLVAILGAQRVFGLDWLLAGRMQAGRVIDGEWWRCVTALTLHLDLGHIIANLLFGAVFGFLGGRILGGGMAWLVIVIAGALGNFTNALVQAPTHSSVGASTAVFAALGVIVSHALRRPGPDRETPMRRWSPLIGGVVLFAYTGVGGERTDVVAHLTGFLAGLLLGWLVCHVPSHWLASRRVQTLAGVASIATVTSAWLVALIVIR